MSKYTVQDLGNEGIAGLQAVLDRTAEDPEFRTLALNDPHAAIREELGVDVPDSFKIKFIDTQDYDIATTLPDPVFDDGLGAELSEAELEYAAGGAMSCGCDEADVCWEDGDDAVRMQ